MPFFGCLKFLIGLISCFTVCSLLICGAIAKEFRVAPGDNVDVAIARLRAGDVLVAESGVYSNQWTISGLHGTSESPIVIRGETLLTSSSILSGKDEEQTTPELTIIHPVSERDGIIFFGGGGSEYVIIENIFVENAKRAGVIVNGSRHIIIRNCVMANNGIWGVQTILSDYISVERCRLYGSRKEHGIYFSTTDHPVALGCNIYGNSGCGIQMNGDVSEGGDGMISFGRIVDNVIHANGRTGGAAINMDGVESTVVSNNLVFNNLSGGMVTFCQGGSCSGSRNKFVNNTVYFKKGMGRFALCLSGGGKNTIVKNNILVCGSGPALDVEKSSISGLMSDDNIYSSDKGSTPIRYGFWLRSLAQWQKITGGDANSKSEYPVFVDPQHGDFRLKEGLKFNLNTPVDKFAVGSRRASTGYSNYAWWRKTPQM